MKLRINEKETPNRTKYHRRKCNLLSDEEYNYWYDIGLEAFNRGDKCIPIRSKELIDYMTKNPAKIGSIESKKSNQMSIAWADGWNFGNLHNNEFKFESLKEAETPNIEVKHEGILEVPEGKNVDDLPLSHFVNLANKKGLSKITKALNNLQIWNKNDDPKLSKWAGDMIDKLNKKLKKDESVSVKDIRAITNSDRAMDYLTKIQSNERNLSNFTPYERKSALRNTRKYVKYINDEIKDTLPIMQQEEDEYNNYFLQNDSNESLTIKEHNRKLKINESMKLTNEQQEIIDTFLEDVKYALEVAFEECDETYTHIDLDIPKSLDDDTLWQGIWETMEDNGISYTVKHKNTKFNYNYYYYVYIHYYNNGERVW